MNKTLSVNAFLHLDAENKYKCKHKGTKYSTEESNVVGQIYQRSVSHQTLILN